jgi:hypothetical protein
MSVKVYGTATPQPYEHSDGTGLDFRDGHLMVTGSAPLERLAIYAPGQWERAEVTK